MYGDVELDGKAAFMAELYILYQDNPLPCVVGGDFNMIRNSSKKNKPSNPNHWSFAFNAIIEHSTKRITP